jgi:hypothetical protein
MINTKPSARPEAPAMRVARDWSPVTRQTRPRNTRPPSSESVVGWNPIVAAQKGLAEFQDGKAAGARFAQSGIGHFAPRRSRSRQRVASQRDLHRQRQRQPFGCTGERARPELSGNTTAASTTSFSGIVWKSIQTWPETARLSSFAPDQRSNVIIGHQFVNADWIRLSDTKPASQNQYGWW